ncbi:MAG: hypothetical protein ABI221_01355, partial [Candidatus Saccharimonadales bacterium]
MTFTPETAAPSGPETTPQQPDADTISRVISVPLIDAVSYSGADATFVEPRPMIDQASPWWD